MEKLTTIQSELKAPKNQYNAFGKYKYRSCEDILEAVKPLLKKHKCTLVITDEVKESGGLVFVEAVCVFSNGNKSEEIEVKAQAGINPDRKGMDIAQSFGSSSSYARKYALNGLFLIDDTKDADTQAPPKKETTKKEVATTKQTLTANQFQATVKSTDKKAIQSVLNRFGMSAEQKEVLEHLISTL